MRKEPKALDFDGFADEFLREKQSRALVILAAAKIDTQLRLRVEKFMLAKCALSERQKSSVLVEKDTASLRSSGNRMFF
jgi:hypothetical protein